MSRELEEHSLVPLVTFSMEEVTLFWELAEHSLVPLVTYLREEVRFLWELAEHSLVLLAKLAQLSDQLCSQ